MSFNEHQRCGSPAAKWFQALVKVAASVSVSGLPSFRYAVCERHANERNRPATTVFPS